MINPELVDVQHGRVRYSQASIKPNFSGASVETWIDDELPYSIPLEVMNVNGEAFVSIDNGPLYAARKYSRILK